MKTVRELATAFNVSKVTIYSALKRDEIKEYVKKQGNISYIDEQGEQLLIKLFKVNSKLNRVYCKVKTSETIENTEVLYLREQNATLNGHLKQAMEELEREREHSRAQAERLAVLAENLAELTRNSQILQAKEKTELLQDNGSRSDRSEGKEKKPFWQRLRKK